MLTPSPYSSLVSKSRHGQVDPEANCNRRLAGSPAFRDRSCRRVSTAHWTVSTTLENSDRTLSPGVATTRPRCNAHEAAVALRIGAQHRASGNKTRRFMSVYSSGRPRLAACPRDALWSTPCRSGRHIL